jgi:putative hydrolase of the HAD superfamily
MPVEQPQAFRTIFFDVGFTLLYPYPSIPEVCQQVCQQLGLHIRLDDLMPRMIDAEDFFLQHMRTHRQTWSNEITINEFWESYYMNLLRPFVEESDEVRLYQLARAINKEFGKHTSWQLYPDVLPTLAALRSHGYTLGIISDWGLALGPIMRKHHLTGYFECLLISATARHAKPSPYLYEQALQRTNSIADYTLHIGDAYIQDVLGARAAGITPVLLDRQRRLDETAIDCQLIHSLSELPGLLEIA